jgi:hypothetical protein
MMCTASREKRAAEATLRALGTPESLPVTPTESTSDTETELHFDC